MTTPIQRGACGSPGCPCSAFTFAPENNTAEAIAWRGGTGTVEDTMTDPICACNHWSAEHDVSPESEARTGWLAYPDGGGRWTCRYCGGDHDDEDCPDQTEEVE